MTEPTLPTERRPAAAIRPATRRRIAAGSREAADRCDAARPGIVARLGAPPTCRPQPGPMTSPAWPAADQAPSRHRLRPCRAAPTPLPLRTPPRRRRARTRRPACRPPNGHAARSRRFGRQPGGLVRAGRRRSRWLDATQPTARAAAHATTHRRGVAPLGRARVRWHARRPERDRRPRPARRSGRRQQPAGRRPGRRHRPVVVDHRRRGQGQPGRRPDHLGRRHRPERRLEPSGHRRRLRGHLRRRTAGSSPTATSCRARTRSRSCSRTGARSPARSTASTR